MGVDRGSRIYRKDWLPLEKKIKNEGCEIACGNDACFNEAEREESTVEPNLTTAIISRQEAWNKTSEFLFHAIP